MEKFLTLPWRSLIHKDSPGTADIASHFLCHSRSREKLLKGMERIYTIGQVAQVAGVPTSTLRYYERIGLLQAAGRIAGDYRRYGMEALEQLRFIRAAQATGFSLEDVTALLQLRDAPASACQDVQVRTTCRPDWRRRKPPRFTKLVLKMTSASCRTTRGVTSCSKPLAHAYLAPRPGHNPGLR